MNTHLRALALLLFTNVALASDPAPIAFVRVHVIPMDTERVLRDQTLLVERGRITRIGPAGDVEVPKDAQRVDGRGELYVMPGLCDSHMHVIDPDELPLYLTHGVTTVRNMSGEPFHLTWRREIAEGRRLGPTLVTTGPTLESEPSQSSNIVVVTSRDDGERAVERIHAAGYDLLKVYSGLNQEAFLGITSAAQRLNMTVVGHIARSMGLAESLAAGQASIDHAEEYVYTFFASAGEEKIPEAVRITREAGAWVVPTLVAYDTIGRQVGDAAALAKRPEMSVVDPAQLARWQTSSNSYVRRFPPAEARAFGERLAFQKRLVRELHRAGVPLLVGTDAGIAFGVPFVLPGVSLHAELVHLVDCGLTPFEALRAATASPARFLKQERDFGTLAVGMRADLVLLEQSPLENVAHAATIAGVLVRGRWLDKAALDALTSARAQLYRDEARFLRMLDAQGVAQAVEHFRDVRKQDPNARLFRESALDERGLALLAKDRVDDAIALLELNAVAYPDSASAFDSLGAGYARAGAKEKAIASYERSLALDPSNANAQAMIQKLRTP